MQKLTSTLIVITRAIFFFSTFCAIIFWGIAAQERARTITVSKIVPRSFPVLVVSHNSDGRSYTAHIVYQWALKEYLRKTPNWSFTVPEGKEAELSKQLSAQVGSIWQESGNECPFGAGGFQLKRLADGKQQFLVDGSWDDDRVNRGWYTADSKRFYPDRYVWYFGPGLCIMYFIIAFPVVGLTAIVDRLIRARVRKRIADPLANCRLRRVALALSMACLVSIVALFQFAPGDSIRTTLITGIWALAAATEILSFWTVRL